MNISVLDINGKDTGRKVKLSKGVFGAEPNDHAIYLDVKQYLANQRQGTHKAKERGEITGSTRKIKRQKGTGTARAGSIKSPLFRGGGRVFGPQPRNYVMKVNKKLKRLARISALTYKAKNEEIVIVEEPVFETPSTKNFAQMITALGASDKKSMVVLAEQNKNVYLSSRNLQGSKVVTASELNTYETMKVSKLIFTEAAISEIESILS
jgi:large subunit ribosomal protein L4